MTKFPPAAQFEYSFTLENGDAVLASNNGVHKLIITKDRYSFMVWENETGRLRVTTPEGKVVKYDGVGLPSKTIRVPDGMMLVEATMHNILLKSADVKAVHTFSSHSAEAQSFFQKSPPSIETAAIDLSKGHLVVMFENGAYLSLETISDAGECKLTHTFATMVLENNIRKIATAKKK